MVLGPAWQTWADAAKAYWEHQGAESKAARLFALLWGLASVNGYNPQITSVWRDPKRQQELLDRWNAGERRGFIGKPADPSKSKHTRTSFWGRPSALAMDMPSNNIPAVDRIAKELGLGVGSAFRSPDPGHYYVR